MNVDEGWYVKLGGRALDEGGEAGFGVLHNVRCTCSLHSINDRIALQIKVFFSEKKSCNLPNFEITSRQISFVIALGAVGIVCKHLVLNIFIR